MSGQASVNTIKENENKERGKVTFLKRKLFLNKAKLQNTAGNIEAVCTGRKTELVIQKWSGPEKTRQRHQQS